jgi:hypothetical protein
LSAEARLILSRCNLPTVTINQLPNFFQAVGKNADTGYHARSDQDSGDHRLILQVRKPFFH